MRMRGVYSCELSGEWGRGSLTTKSGRPTALADSHGMGGKRGRETVLGDGAAGVDGCVICAML
jgi:hypothetical protein